MTKLVVLASGSGSNLQAILDACANGDIDATVEAVVSDQPNARALTRAIDAGVASVVVTRADREPRNNYDARLAEVVSTYEPDWVVLAGWMRILTMDFLGAFASKVVNLHPALPGELPGIRAIERAWDEAVIGQRTHSGVMVHLVPDEGVDDGPVLATRQVPIDTSGTLETFAAAVHITEHQLLVETIAELCASPTLRAPNP